MDYYNKDNIIESIELKKKKHNTNESIDRIHIDMNDYLKFDSVPNICQNCMNHPVNGGSGICHCTLGLSKITW